MPLSPHHQQQAANNARAPNHLRDSLLEHLIVPDFGTPSFHSPNASSINRPPARSRSEVIPERLRSQNNLPKAISRSRGRSKPRNRNTMVDLAKARRNSLDTISMEEFQAEYLLMKANEAQTEYDARKKLESLPRQPLANSTPVLIGTSKASEFVPKFTSLCQTKGIQPAFEFFTPSGVMRALKGAPGGSPGFGAKVTFAGEEVISKGPWNSKKEAKERVAEEACQILETLNIPRPEVGPAVQEENYIGLLTEHLQAIAKPPPVWSEFRDGEQAFSYEVTMDAYPDQIFGSRDALFPNKKAAKVSAAREAVVWLRENGHFELRLKKKVKMTSTAALTPTPIPNAGASSSAQPQPTTLPDALDDADDLSSTGTSQQKLSTLLPMLSMNQNSIQYDLYPSSATHAGYWDCTASFPGKLFMPQNIGLVRNVLGKKAAKEECAKCVAIFLEKIMEDRAKKAKELLEGA